MPKYVILMFSHFYVIKSFPNLIIQHFIKETVLMTITTTLLTLIKNNNNKYNDKLNKGFTQDHNVLVISEIKDLDFIHFENYRHLYHVSHPQSKISMRIVTC